MWTISARPVLYLKLTTKPGPMSKLGKNIPQGIVAHNNIITLFACHSMMPKRIRLVVRALRLSPLDGRTASQEEAWCEETNNRRVRLAGDEMRHSCMVELMVINSGR
ncbi:hypothetical protein EMCRGX_G030108 [Ephydatia muelleri]